MKQFTKLVVFILLFYSCKEKLNEPKQENINAYNQYSTLDRSPILDSIDSASISEIPIFPPTEGLAINIDYQILLNLKLPEISGKDSNELIRNADRRHEAFTRYLRRNDPTYKPHQISGVSIVQMDKDYEALFKLAEIERKKIEKKSRQNANKLFGE